jgi:hypothetical protein
MRNITLLINGFMVCAIAALFSLPVTAQNAQPGSRLRQPFDMGRGMSPLNGDLMQIASKTSFFLEFSDAIKLSPEQKKTLEETYFEMQKYAVRRKADLDVIEAETRRLLSNERVDLEAVRVKIKEAELIQSDATMTGIEATLRAINVLTHAQHLKIMILVQQKQSQQAPLLDG